MKKNVLVLVFIFVGMLTIVAQTPPDPGAGAEVPLDGGLITALLIGGGVVSAFFAKRKK